MISAITYMLDDGWYSKREPGSQCEAPAREAREALAAVEELVGPERRVREARGVREELLDRDDLLAVRRRTRGRSRPRARRGSSLPSWISSQPAAEVIAFVAEKTT